MQKRRAILVNGSRLLREFVKRVIEKKAGFEVIRELEEIQDLPSAIVDTNAEWVIVTLSENQEIPESMKMELLRENPPLHLLVCGLRETM